MIGVDPILERCSFHGASSLLTPHPGHLHKRIHPSPPATHCPPHTRLPGPVLSAACCPAGPSLSKARTVRHHPPALVLCFERTGAVHTIRTVTAHQTPGLSGLLVYANPPKQAFLLLLNPPKAKLTLAPPKAHPGPQSSHHSLPMSPTPRQDFRGVYGAPGEPPEKGLLEQVGPESSPPFQPEKLHFLLSL